MVALVMIARLLLADVFWFALHCGPRVSVERLRGPRSTYSIPRSDTDTKIAVYKNVAALLCMPLRCTALDCDGEVARTP
jgi:hypothetical protein